MYKRTAEKDNISKDNSSMSTFGTSGGPVPPVRYVGPQPVDDRALVVHGIPIHMSVDKIFWHADRLRVGVGERVVKAGWLVGLDRRRGKTASFLVLYFSGVVPVRGKVLRFASRWCPVDHYEFEKRSDPSACTRRGLW